MDAVSISIIVGSVVGAIIGIIGAIAKAIRALRTPPDNHLGLKRP